MLKVLVVDDSLIARRNINKFLTNLGFSVVDEAKNGLEAVEKARKIKPDLITMDITMPGMDGIDAVKAIKEFDDNVKIIMATSHGQEQMVLASIKAGARGYILKPITQEKLLVALNKAFPELNLGGDMAIEDIETIELSDNL